MFSTLSSKRVAGTLVAVALAAATMAPGAFAQDTPGADAHEAAEAAAQQRSGYDDLRSPDAQDTDRKSVV